MAKKRKAPKFPTTFTLNCTCNNVGNDPQKLGGKSFKNVKNADGNCFCFVNNNRTGKTTKIKQVDSIIIAQRIKPK